MKIYLAKARNLYYLCCAAQSAKSCLPFKFRNFKVLFLVLISVLAVASNLFAEPEKKSEDLADEYRMRGYEEQQKGHLDDALSWYFKAVTISPNYAPALNDVGLIYESLGMDDKAEDSYLSAIQSDKKYLPAYSNLGYFYKNKQNLGQAIVYFRKRITLGDPTDPWTQKAKAELKNIYEQSPFLKRRMVKREAEKLKQKMAAASRARLNQEMLVSKGYYNRGLKLSQQKKYSQAIKIFDEGLRYAPDNPKILAARAAALHGLNNQTALEQVRQGLKFLEEGKNASARNRLREVLTILPNEGTHQSGK